MKTLIALSVVLLLCAVSIPGVLANTNATATAQVYVTVSPNVSLTPVTSLVNAGTVETGEVTADVVFTIDANQEQASFYVEASPLYKGDDPTNTAVAPIALQDGSISVANGNPLAGYTNCLTFGATGAPINGFPTLLSNTIPFESSQDGTFSQNVTVAIDWMQPNPQQPTGQYSGWVRLTALLLPTT